MSQNLINSICILNNTLGAGGAEKNCVILCNELANKGIDVELWITRLGDSPLLKLIDSRVKVRSIPGKRVRNSFSHLKRMLIDSNSKTILIYNIELLIPAFFINKIYNLKLKIIARSITTLSYDYNNYNYFTKKIWFYLIGYTGNRISKMIAQSEGMKEDLIKNFNINESKITVIPNPSFNFIDNAKVNIIENKNELLFVGRITEAKGIQYLLQIFQIAQNEIPDLHLTIVGTGEILPEIVDKVINLGLSKYISFEGYQTDLAKYYTSAKLTVLTSIVEGFPNVLIESISYGTPVISFDCPSGPRDIIVPHENGILIEHLNVSAFANAIINVMNGKIVFDKKKVINTSLKYNLKEVVGQYEKILF